MKFFNKYNNSSIKSIVSKINGTVDRGIDTE